MVAIAQPATQPAPNRQTPRAPARAREPVWVFESSRGAPDLRGAAEIAVKCHGAKYHNGSGAAGNSYAIVTRDADNRLLPNDELREQVQKFLDCAAAHPKRTFRIVASPYTKSDDEHLKFAEMFQKAPKNCELPGRLLERLGRLDKTRIILLDSAVKAVDAEARTRTLDHYFGANEGLWNTAGVEIVSFGLAHTIVQNDKYAKGRGYDHRITSVDPKRYAKNETMARQILSVSYSTKLVCFIDPMGTSTGFHMVALQFAAAAGLAVDDVILE